MKRKITLITLLIISLIDVFSCTIGIASPGITASNKPLLWKSRDISPNTINTIRYVENMTYDFVGICTPNDTRMWMGVNEMGFAIANSLSNDLTIDTGSFNNGNFIYNALGLVGNLDQLENYLDYLTTTNPFDLELRGNFVAFDANGNSKLYEVNNNNYWVFETGAGESPYILRTNHSVNGGGTEGIERLLRSSTIIQNLVFADNLDVPNILLHEFRDVSDSQSEAIALPWQFGDATPSVSTDYSICRRNTISAVVIEGVEAGQDPKLTTMWLIMGNPFVSYALPIMPTIKPNLAAINTLSENSPELVNILWSANNDYLLDTSHFVNSDNFSLLQSFSDLENERYQAMETIKSQWNNNEIDDNDVRDFINQAVTSTLNFSTELFYDFTPNNDSEVVATPSLNVYPNPFRSEVTIKSFSTKRDSAKVKIFNLKGQLVKALTISNENSYHWDGRNIQNEKMANGIYLIKYESKDLNVTQKVLLLK